jgi:hypothetical protein
MKYEHAKFCIATLQKTFDKKFNVEGLAKIKDSLLMETEAALTNACDYFILNTAFLPSPAQLLDQTKREGRKLRMAQGIRIEDEERARKKQEYLDNSILSRKYGSGLMKDWTETLLFILEDEPKHTYDEIVPKLWELERKYPGLHFGETAKEWTEKYLDPF